MQIGASTDALYKLRNRPDAEEFRAAWDAAVDRGVMRLEDTALARAIEGEERMVVLGGKCLGFETRFNEQLVMFFLRNRRGERYAPDWRALRPGHPLYERIAAEAVARYRAGPEQEQEAATLESLDLFFEGLKQRRLANEALFAEQAAADEAREAEKQARAAERARPGEPEEDGEA